MIVCVFGADSLTGRAIVRKISQQGMFVRAVVWDEKSLDRLHLAGVEAVAADERTGDVESALGQSDATVFSTCTEGISRSMRNRSLDMWGALNTYPACRKKGIKRYILVNATCPTSARPWSGWIQSKPSTDDRLADEYLVGSGLDYTIIHSARPVIRQGTGKVEAIEESEIPSREIPIEDLAAFVSHCLTNPATIAKTCAIASGKIPIESFFHPRGSR